MSSALWASTAILFATPDDIALTIDPRATTSRGGATGSRHRRGGDDRAVVGVDGVGSYPLILSVRGEPVLDAFPRKPVVGPIGPVGA